MAITKDNSSEVIESAIREILVAIKENPDRQGLKETPKRIVEMYKEIYKGYDLSQKPSITVFDNGKDQVVYDEMIFDKGYFFSMCEHHMLPFFGEYYFAYIPNKKIIGLSKIARLIDFYSARLQIQERLTNQVVDEVEKAINPKGIALVMKARHLCKEMRGIKKVNSEMVTSALKGAFKKNIHTREEFLRFISE